MTSGNHEGNGVMERHMTKVRSMETEETKVEHGSGNIFADLDCSEAEVHFLKAELVTCIDEIIRRRKLRRVEVAKLLGLSQSDVSRFLKGNFRDYSVEQLLRFLTLLGRDVEIVIQESRLGRQGRLSVATP